MEEDIKILEEQLEQYKRHLKNYEKENCLTSVYCELKEYAEALENLIKAYKEQKECLEKTSQALDNIAYDQIPIAIEELRQSDKERIKELEEDNYTYHQLMQMQNAREYRSKFLKDFKKEYGENVMPDYDEIYKRYDKQKRELENSIPKSLIKEKIEELNKTILEYEEYRKAGKETDVEFYDFIANSAIVEFLQEILKGENNE